MALAEFRLGRAIVDSVTNYDLLLGAAIAIAEHFNYTDEDDYYEAMMDGADPFERFRP